MNNRTDKPNITIQTILTEAHTTFEELERKYNEQFEEMKLLDRFYNSYKLMNELEAITDPIERQGFKNLHFMDLYGSTGELCSLSCDNQEDK